MTTSIVEPDLDKGIPKNLQNKASKSSYACEASFSDVPLFDKFNLYKCLN